jgi:hypothetical protein
MTGADPGSDWAPDADGETESDELLLTPTDSIRPVGSTRPIDSADADDPDDAYAADDAGETLETTDELLQSPTESIRPVGGRPSDADERDVQTGDDPNDSVPDGNTR